MVTTASAAYDTSDSNLKSITELQNRVKTLDDTVPEYKQFRVELQEREKDYKGAIDNLEKQLDDQINRSMRCNLVFSGVKESEGQNRSTKDIVSDFIYDELYSQGDNITKEQVNRLIVRAHRSKYTGERQTPRPIFVKFSRDDIAAYLYSQSIKHRVTDRGYRVRPQHTKPLQDRISKALLHRRELLRDGTITKGYVEYPAVLKGVLKSAKSHEYTTIKSF